MSTGPENSRHEDQQDQQREQPPTPDQMMLNAGILGVRDGATQAEIASAYRAAARRYHPDANGGAGDGQRFQEVRDAFELLERAIRAGAWQERPLPGARQQERRENQPNPEDILGVGANASPEEIDRAFQALATRYRGRDEQRYRQAYESWSQMRGADERRARAENHENENFNRYMERLNTMSQRAAEEVRERGRSAYNFVSRNKLFTAIILGGILITTAIKCNSSGPKIEKPLETPDTSRQELVAEQPEQPAPPYPQADRAPKNDKLPKREKEPAGIIEAPAESQEETSTPEESVLNAPKQPEAEEEMRESQIMSKELEREIKKDFRDIVGTDKVWSEGNGFFIAKKGKNYFRVGPEVFANSLGPIRNNFREMEETVNKEIQEPGKKAFNFSKIMRGKLERAREKAKKDMLEVLNEYKIPEEKVSQALENAEDLQKKAEQTRKEQEKTQSFSQKIDGKGHINPANERKNQRDYATKSANKKYKPRNR